MWSKAVVQCKHSSYCIHTRLRVVMTAFSSICVGKLEFPEKNVVYFYLIISLNYIYFYYNNMYFASAVNRNIASYRCICTKKWITVLLSNYSKIDNYSTFKHKKLSFRDLVLMIACLKASEEEAFYNIF